jgi:hypothetical protein
MVTVKLFGGLGNQMFQYAFSLSYSKKGRQLKYHVNSVEYSHFKGNCELTNAFPTLQLIMAGKRDFFFYMESFFDKKRNEKIFRLKSDRYYIEETNEEEFTLIKDVHDRDNIYLSGYWQHEGYFKEFRKELKKVFFFEKFKDGDLWNKSLAEKIIHSNSVSVHVRLGDYLQSTVHKVLTMNYYVQAIELINSKISNAEFFIFSDDEHFVTRYFFDKGMTIVNCNKHIDSYKDMQLMGMCRHNIIANSTFSWWAAWLNDNHDKIVVSPKQWFNNDKDISGLLLNDWIKL